MPSNDTHFSGEGHLIEAEILGDSNKTIVPVACDSEGRLLVDLTGSIVDIGIVQIEDSTGNPIVATGGAINENLTAVGGAPITEGQKTMANSIPVVIASDQTPIPVTGTFTTSPNVNVHDGAGNTISSTGTSLNVDVTNFPATQPVSGTVAVSNFPATQPVSGTVSVTQSTSPWVVSGTVTTTPPSNASTNLTEVGGAPISEGQKLMATSIPVVIASDQSTIPVSGTITTSPNVNVHDGSGNTIASTGTSLNVDVTNTVPVTLTSTTITGNVTVVQPTGTNLHTVIDSGTTTVTQATGTNLHTVVDSGTITLSGTSPVSGTVTANQGTPNTLANGWPVELSDGTNLLGISAHPVRIDPTGTTTQPISGTVTANAGTNLNTSALALDTSVKALEVTQGSTTSGQSGILELGAVTTAAPTYVTAQTSPLSLNTSGGLRVDGSGVTQPVSGTVTTAPPANASTNITQVAGTSLGATAVVNYGTTPAAAAVPGVNAFVTNTVAVSGTVTANGVAQGSTTSGETGPLVQGAVTTSAPTYVTAQTNPLSLTTAGSLRTTDASIVAQASTTSGQTGQLVMGAVTTNNPSYSTGQTSPVSLSTAGQLRVTAVGNGLTTGASFANNTNIVYFSDVFGDVAPTWVLNSFSGGNFSGTANAAKQGITVGRTPTVFKTISATASGNTAVWTAGTGNKWRLLGFKIDITSNSTLSAGAVLVIDLQDVSTTISLTQSVFVPTTSVTTTISDNWSTGWISLGNFGIVAAATATALNVNLSAALTAGACRVVVCGTEE